MSKMSKMSKIDETEQMIVKLSDDFTRIISTEEILEKYPKLYWGGNGVGDRLWNKKFNYTVIYGNKKTKTYPNEYDDKIDEDMLSEFLKNKGGSGIIGVFVYSKRLNTQKRDICPKIHKKITSMSCVVCGNTTTICDHKNDLYNDERVLNTKTQLITDFQPLCNHCNLQKRQVCKRERETEKIYSAKNIESYKSFPFEFPWEKYAFDKNSINCKSTTYWYDPVEFNKNIYSYSQFVPVINEIKKKIKLES
jgi:hypothetical protein